MTCNRCGGTLSRPDYCDRCGPQQGGRRADVYSSGIDNGVARKADGLDAASVGVGYRSGQPELLVYDTELVIRVLMDRDSMSHDVAEEFMDFNLVGGWHGEGTPIWLYRDAD